MTIYTNSQIFQFVVIILKGIFNPINTIIILLNKQIIDFDVQALQM